MLLLSLDDRKGTPAMSTYYLHAMGGAVVAELILLGRILYEEQKRKTLVQVVDTRLTGDALLDECFTEIRNEKRPKDVATWIARFHSKRGLLHRVAERLWLAGLLRKEEKSVLLVFRRVVYPAQDNRAKNQVRERLRNALLTDSPIDERTRTAIAVARHTILARLLDRAEQKARKQRIEALTKNDPNAKAIRRTIASGHAH
jgi:hypothetical protein